MPRVNHPIVGSVKYSVGAKGRLILEEGWEAKNIGTVFIPELVGKPSYGIKLSGNIRFYKKAIPQLKAAFAELGRRGLVKKILHWDGSFVPRLKRGGSTPSNHSFGTALDVNAEWNGFKQRPADPGETGDLHEVAQVFKKFGFIWGGDWRNTPDGMHFEIARILSAAELKALQGVVTGIPATENSGSVPVPSYDGPGFEIVVLNTGMNVGPGLIYKGRLYGPIDETLNEVGLGIVRSGDKRKRSEQPRFYVLVGDKAK